MTVAEPVLGIDFGTSYCRAAVTEVAESGRLTTRLLSVGKSSAMPSLAGLGAAGDWVAGDGAARLAAIHPAAVIAGAKKFLGRSAEDATPMTHPDWGGPGVCAGRDGAAMINLRAPGTSSRGQVEVWPSRPIVELLRLLKARANSLLGIPVSLCVLGIPASFGPNRREVLAQAARLAGLEVLSLIDEGLAVALARGVDPTRDRPSETLIVADMGGGFTGLTVVARRGRRYNVLGSSGFDQAGDELDDCLSGSLLEDMARQPGWPAEPDPVLIGRVRAVVTRAKAALSTQEVFAAVIPHTGRTFSSLIARSQLERAAGDLTCKVRERARELWLRAEASSGQAKTLTLPMIVPAGGHGPATFFRRALELAMADVRVCDAMPADAVATGAALWGHAVVASEQEASAAGGRLLASRRSPWSLFLKGAGGVQTLVPAHSTLPCKVSRSGLTTTTDNQERAILRIMQGAGDDSATAIPIGEVRLAGIAPALTGEARIRLDFALSSDGRLGVSVHDLSQRGLEASLHFYGSPSDQEAFPEAASSNPVPE